MKIDSYKPSVSNSVVLVPAVSEDVLAETGTHYKQVSANPDIYMVPMPYRNLSFGETITYIVRDGDDVLVVDMGAPTRECADWLLAAVDELGIDLASASFFLTHLHLDHAGLVDELVAPSAPLYLGRTDFEYMKRAHDSDYMELMEKRLMAEGCGAISRRYARVGMGVDSFTAQGRSLIFVDDGDEIAVGRERMRVVATPGHTPGHMSLYHERSKTFIAGDHLLFIITPNLGLRADITTTMETYFASLRTMVAMDIERVLVSHGTVQGDWRERAEFLINRHSMRCGLAKTIASETPGITGEALVRSLRWSVTKPWDEIELAMKWCLMECGLITIDHALACGLLERRVDDEGIYRYYARE